MGRPRPTPNAANGRAAPRRAAQSWSDLRPAVGYGAGVRYGSPVGQLKLDLAWGHETRQAWLHLTVDVPF